MPQLSTYTMAPRTYDSQPYCNQLTRPAGLEGWQDIKHKAQLSSEDKKAINVRQRQEGFKQTQW